MHDIKLIREQPEVFDAGMNKRGLPAMATEILALDKKWRQAQLELEQALAKRNELSALVATAKKSGKSGEAEQLIQSVAALKTQIPLLEQAVTATKIPLDEILASLPNLPHASVPVGRDEKSNQEIRQWGKIKKITNALPHDELGAALTADGVSQMDFITAANISGARFVFLRKDLARLERALAQFMLNTHIDQFGYEEVSPPLLVTNHTVFGTGQLPKFADDLFQTTDGRWLIPTAEVSLTAQMVDGLWQESVLPKRYVAHTPCFRSEAGAAGKDTKGMIRQHQFWKVELVSLTAAENSEQELERMTNAAETILQRLELPYRLVLLCSGDMGFAAQKTYDLEVFLPAQNCYREISSCSNVGDFQARRLNGRYRANNPQKTAKFLHSLNGSGLAVGRALVAVMENYQESNGDIVVPSVLLPYMNGLKKIVRG